MSDTSVFKGGIFDEVMGLTKKTSPQVILASLLFFILTLIPLAGIFAIVFAQSANFDLTTIQNLQNDPAAAQAFGLQMVSMFQSPAFIAGMVVLFLIMILISAWQYNLNFLLVNRRVFDDTVDFSKAFKDSMNRGIFRIIGFILLSYLVLAVLGGLVAGLSYLAGGIGAFFGSIIVIVYVYRWLLILPAFLIGNKSLSDAITFSHRHITWIRALKLFGASILFGLVLMALFFIIGLLGMALNFIPFVGVVFNYALQVVLTGVITAFMVSLMVGLYYRYADIVGNEEGDPLDYLVGDSE
ncbi:hypothetical protein KFE98_14075 [bacterium SCSIO 12741]|nr:hypothetical protein KFE98_14075 [bacterium SCSIO 12741]